MSFDQVISDVVRFVEATGAAIMIIGGLLALLAYATTVVQSSVPPDEAYRKLRERLGRSILLGLEVLIVGDIVRTIIVNPTISSVTVLAMVVFIRIILSFSLEVEIDGVWPWSRWRLAQSDNPTTPSDRRPS